MNGRDIFSGLIVVIIWGINFIAIKVGLQEVPPLLLGSLRFFIVLFPAIFLLPRPPVPWRWLIALGLTINVGQFACLFIGIKLGMPAGLASLVLQAQAFFTALMAVRVLKESWRWNNLAGLALAAGGMTVIGFQQDAGMTASGFWFTLAAAFCWGIGNIIMRKITQGVPPFSMVSLTVWSGAVAILPLAVLSWFIEGPLDLPALTWGTTISLIYLSYVSTLIGYGLWGKLMARYPAAVVSPFALLVPVVGISSSSLILGETVSFWQAVGALLVMAGLVVHVFGTRWSQEYRIAPDEQ